MERTPKQAETRAQKFARSADSVAILLTTVVGIAFGIWQFAFSPTTLLPGAVGVMISLLGFLGLHAAVQRETTFRDIRASLEALLVAAEHTEIERDARDLYIRTMRRYMRILEYKSRLQDDNSGYAKVVARLLADPLVMVKTLADGRLEVREYLSALAFHRLLEAYNTRFDAVTANDLGFWRSSAPTDYAYRQVNFAAAKQMLSTRLFILSEKVVKEERAHIVEVLTDQIKEGIACALAVHEDFAFKAQTWSGHLDFALFAGGQAVSFFRGQAHGYAVTFRTCDKSSDNDEILAAQVDIYHALLPECWLVTDRFRGRHLATESPVRKAALEQASAPRSAALKQLGFDVDDERFPLVVGQIGEIGTKLDKLVEMRQKLRGTS